MAAIVREIGRGRLLLDLRFRSTEGLVASYLIPQEGGYALIETGPSSCGESLREGVSAAGVEPGQIRRIFVTHIHLDHSGGLGAIAGAFPRAELFAHAEGVPHLIDPSRLVASARRTWGPATDALWGAIEPVPPLRLHPLRGGERFDVEGGTLLVLNTPGHAKHHLSFVDSATGGLFTGDSAGVRLEGSGRSRPAVPPPDLDLEELFESLERMKAAAPRTLLYSHFGPSEGGTEELDAYRQAVEEWRDVALRAAREEASVPHVAAALRDFEERVTRERGLPAPGVEQGVLVSSFEVAAQGLLRYFRQKGWVEGKG